VKCSAFSTISLFVYRPIASILIYLLDHSIVAISKSSPKACISRDTPRMDCSVPTQALQQAPAKRHQPNTNGLLISQRLPYQFTYFAPSLCEPFVASCFKSCYPAKSALVSQVFRLLGAFSKGSASWASQYI